MRVLQSGLYSNFLQDQASAKSKINRLTTQISSGQKIEHSYENSSVYVDSLRLDSEITALKGVQSRTEKSKVHTDASDTVMGQFNDALRDFKTKLVLASNGTLNSENLKSLAADLQKRKDDMVGLANTSVNGEYLFSGTAVGTKPIDEKGDYQGNNESLKVQISASTKVPYSVDGESLFFGVDSSVNKTISSNVQLKNQTTDEALKSDDTIESMMGQGGSTYFYVSGVKHDGEAFKTKITLDGSESISKLLSEVENVYGDKDIRASLSETGTITIVDEKKGLSHLDFQMIASNEDVSDVSTLTSSIMMNKGANGVSNDKAAFDKEDNVLHGNIALIDGESIATPTSKLSDIAQTSLDGKTFQMDIRTINGDSKTIELNLSASSSFSVDGTSYSIFNADDSNGLVQTKADDLTLGQLESVVSMVMADTLPASNTKADFESAIVEANKMVEVGQNSSGALEVVDKSGNNKDISFSLYDKDTDDFSKSSSLSFMGNRAVIVKNPKIDLFKDLDQVIQAVRDGIMDPDASSSSPNNPGIKKAIDALDVLSSHFSDSYTEIGAMSNNLQHASEKAATLELNVSQLKSTIADVDLAETITKYQQVSLNYQAMMSTVAKVNSLTLLNYLK